MNTDELEQHSGLPEPQRLPEEPNQLSFDEMIAQDEHLSCIFADAIISIEERGLNPETVEDVNPITYCSNLETKFKNFKQNFDSAKVRQEFFQDTITSQQQLHSLETRVIEDRKLDILRDIPPTHIKDVKTIRFLDHELEIPMIKTEHIGTYVDVFNRIIEINLDAIQANLSIRGLRLQKDKTRCEILNYSKCVTKRFARDDDRISLNAKMATALILDVIRNENSKQTDKYLVERQTVDDEIEGGMYIRLDRPALFDRTTMMQPESVGVEMKINYNLNMKQLRYIISYMFSRDPAVRTESKIELLSSVRGDTRNDITLNCEKVLLHAVREHYLTRKEIIELFFYHYDNSQKQHSHKCPCCQTVVRTNMVGIIHGKCDLVDWLITHFQFNYENETISTPSFGYIKPGVANYARKAYATQTRLQNTPFVAKTSDGFQIYRVNPDGLPSKLVHEGSKPVKISAPAPSGSRR